MSIIPYRESQRHTYVESKYKNMLPPPLVNDIEIRGKSSEQRDIIISRFLSDHNPRDIEP